LLFDLTNRRPQMAGSAAKVFKSLPEKLRFVLGHRLSDAVSATESVRLYSADLFFNSSRSVPDVLALLLTTSIVLRNPNTITRGVHHQDGHNIVKPMNGQGIVQT
jgi:hypothetical protein